MNEFIELAKFGWVGIVLACLAVIVYVVKEFKTIIINHISHTNDIIVRNAEASTKLSECIRENTDITKETNKLILTLK